MPTRQNVSVPVMILLCVFVIGPLQLIGQLDQRSQKKLDEYNQQFCERMEYVMKMSQLSKMLGNKALHKELELVPEQVERLKQTAAEFQKSQIEFTMKNGDRQQEVNRLIAQHKVDEAVALADEMYGVYDEQAIDINDELNEVLLPHQIERILEIGKQQYFSHTSPFRDQFGVAYGLTNDIELSSNDRSKLQKRIADIRKKFYRDVDKLREKAINDVVKSFPKEHQSDVKKIVVDYYDPDKQARLAKEVRFHRGQDKE